MTFQAKIGWVCEPRNAATGGKKLIISHTEACAGGHKPVIMKAAVLSRLSCMAWRRPG
jgi:hypothetical protein